MGASVRRSIDVSGVRRHKWIGIIDDSSPIQNGSRRGLINESMIQTSGLRDFCLDYPGSCDAADFVRDVVV
jgi:hypothetical protein